MTNNLSPIDKIREDLGLKPITNFPETGIDPATGLDKSSPLFRVISDVNKTVEFEHRFNKIERDTRAAQESLEEFDFFKHPFKTSADVLGQGVARTAGFLASTIKTSADVLGQGVARTASLLTPKSVAEGRTGRAIGAAIVGFTKGAVFEPIDAISNLITGKRPFGDALKFDEVFEEYDKQLEKEDPELKGIAAGWHMSGTVLPYLLGEEVIAAGVSRLPIRQGKEIMTVAKALDKLRPAHKIIASGIEKGIRAVGFTTTGQILYTDERQMSRAESAAWDLALFGIFDAGGFIAKKALGLASNVTKNAISKFRNGGRLTLEEAEHAVQEGKGALIEQIRNEQKSVNSIRRLNAEGGASKEAAIDLEITVNLDSLRQRLAFEQPTIDPRIRAKGIKKLSVQVAGEPISVDVNIDQALDIIESQHFIDLSRVDTLFPVVPKTTAAKAVATKSLAEINAAREKIGIKPMTEGEFSKLRRQRGDIEEEVSDIFTRLESDTEVPTPRGQRSKAFEVVKTPEGGAKLELAPGLEMDMSSALARLRRDIFLELDPIKRVKLMEQFDASLKRIQKENAEATEKAIAKEFGGENRRQAAAKLLGLEGRNINNEALDTLTDSIDEKELLSAVRAGKKQVKRKLLPEIKQKAKEVLERFKKTDGTQRGLIEAITQKPFIEDRGTATRSANTYAKSLGYKDITDMYNKLKPSFKVTDHVIPPSKVPLKKHAPIDQNEIDGVLDLRRTPEEAIASAKTNAKEGGVFMAPLDKEMKKVKAEDPSAVPENITVIEKDRDMTDWQKVFSKILVPPRGVALWVKNGTKIVRSAINATLGYRREFTVLDNRIKEAIKGVSKKEKPLLVKLLDKNVTEEELSALPKHIQESYKKFRVLFEDIRQLVKENNLADIGKWSISPEEYFPHVFIGEYQIITGVGNTIDNGIQKTLGEALDAAREYLIRNPNTKLTVMPRKFNSALVELDRTKFWKLVTELSKGYDIGKKEALSLMKGVAKMAPRGKFVGNFQQRISNIAGFVDDPEMVSNMYVSRILQKKYFDPLIKSTYEDIKNMPIGFQKYFEKYIDDVVGKFNPEDLSFKFSGILSKITKTQTFLKLGFRPRAAVLNRLQPLQTTLPEVGGVYLSRAEIMQSTKEGKSLIAEAGIQNMPIKYYSGEFKEIDADRFFGGSLLDKGLFMFSNSEKANRKTTFLSGYLFATEKLGMTRKQAVEWGKDLVIDTQFLYSAADLPTIFRHPIGRLVLQFKPFTVNYLYTASRYLTGKPLALASRDLSRAEKSSRAFKFLATSFTLGGLRAIPFAARIGLVYYLMEQHPKLSRGIFSALGVDFSSAVAPGVEYFFPQDIEDLLGVSGSDLALVAQVISGDKDPNEVRNIFPALDDVITAYEIMVDSGNYLRGERGRAKVELTGIDAALKVGGFQTIKESEARRLSQEIAVMQREASRKKDKYVDRILSAQDKGNWEEARRLRNEAAQPSYTMSGFKIPGVNIYEKDIVREEVEKDIPSYERIQASRDTEEEVKEKIEKFKENVGL